MTKKAWMFPGQGSQYVGMGRELLDDSSHAQKLMDKTEDITGRPIRRIMLDGPKEALNRTSNTQVGLVFVSLAALGWYLKKHRGERPDFVAGHSVGELAAYVAAGSISEEDAIYLANERGLAMEEAGDDHPGGMAAILGVPDSEVEKIAANNGVFPANYNVTDQQIVIAGEEAQLDEASREAAEVARRVIRLGVTIPAHTVLIAGARRRVVEAVDKISIVDPLIPAVANKTGQIMTRASEIRESIPEQLVNPVWWAKGVEYMHDHGVRHFTEIGAQNVLSGIVRRQLGSRPADIDQHEHEVKRQK